MATWQQPLFAFSSYYRGLIIYWSGVQVPEGPHQNPSITRGVFAIQQYSDIVKYMANGDTKSGDTLLIMIPKAPNSELPYNHIDD